VVVKGYCDEVVVSYIHETVARHRRIWQREHVSFDPLHYLAVLERKPGALDHARPLQGWTLQECFEHLRRRLEAEYEQGGGTREYIRVLRLLEKHPLPALRRAVEKGLSMGALQRDAIAQFLYPQEEWRTTRFTLDGQPPLRLPNSSEIDSQHTLDQEPAIRSYPHVRCLTFRPAPAALFVRPLHFTSSSS